jgi:hypothetical protein
MWGLFQLAGIPVSQFTWRADPASVLRGEFRGYRDEAGVAPDSTVETYVAVKRGAPLPDTTTATAVACAAGRAGRCG